jgi:hypothetical protein
MPTDPTDPTAAVPGPTILEVLVATEAVLRRRGWSAAGANSRHGPCTLTEALAEAAFGPATAEEDQAAIDRFAAAWTILSGVTATVAGRAPGTLEEAFGADRVLAAVQLAQRVAATTPAAPAGRILVVVDEAALLLRRPRSVPARRHRRRRPATPRPTRGGDAA